MMSLTQNKLFKTSTTTMGKSECDLVKGVGQEILEVIFLSYNNLDLTFSR